jgi:hypothetical protein
MKELATLLGVLFFLSSPLPAIEIESKDGRSFSATVVDADETTVTVKKLSGGREFIIKRETLALETNQNIEEFLKEKRDQADAKKGKRSTFELGAKNRRVRVSLRLPNPDVPIVPSESSVVISGEGRALGNQLQLDFRWGPDDTWAEKEMNTQKQGLLRGISTRPGATQLDVETANKILNVEKITFGEWSGFILGEWTDLQAKTDKNVMKFGGTQKYAAITNGKIRIRVRISTEESGKFRFAFLPDIIESLTVEDLVKPEAD